MELNQFAQTAYRMIQGLFGWVPWEKLIGSLRARWDGRTVGEAASGTVRFVLAAVAVGLVIDWILYWTREDQASLFHRMWGKLRGFFPSGEERQR